MGHDNNNNKRDGRVGHDKSDNNDNDGDEADPVRRAKRTRDDPPGNLWGYWDTQSALLRFSPLGSPHSHMQSWSVPCVSIN